VPASTAQKEDGIEHAHGIRAVVGCYIRSLAKKQPLSADDPFGPAAGLRKRLAFEDVEEDASTTTAGGAGESGQASSRVKRTSPVRKPSVSSTSTAAVAKATASSSGAAIGAGERGAKSSSSGAPPQAAKLR